MRNFIYILLLLLASLGVETAKAQQFQPLFLIEWGDSNGLVPVTSNFMGFDGVQVYVRLDSLIAAELTKLQVGVCKDTITQAAHGFSVGDLIGQTAGFGDYFQANTSSPDSLPVAAVLKVIDANRFVPCNEGFFPYTHGLSNGVDYFLQDNGSLASTPDSNYNVFGFRTFGTSVAYFDIPELVVESVDSSGTTGQTIEDADWYDNRTNAPPTVMGADIYTTGSAAIGDNLTLGLNGGFRTERLFVELSAAAGSQVARFGSGDNWDLRIYRDGSGMWLGNRNGPTSDHSTIFFPSATNNYMSFYVEGTQSFRITTDGYLVYYQCPSYLNDAAADADSSLPAGGIYQITGDRTLYIKP